MSNIFGFGLYAISCYDEEFEKYMMENYCPK